MNQSNGPMDPPPATTEEAGRKSTPTTVVLHGRRLFVARLACVALAALTVGLFIASVPDAYKQLGTYQVALRIVFALGYWAIGAILFWKSSGHRVALYASVALVTFGTVQADTLHSLQKAHQVWDLPVALVYFVGEVAFFVLFCVFPDGRFVPRWTRWAAVAWITYWLLDSFFPNWPLVIRVPLLLGLIVSLVVAQIYRYRRVSGPLEREQTKWVVFGLTATIAAFVVVLLINWILASTQSGISPALIEDLSITTLLLFALLIPLSIGVAIRRYRLWEIDLIINRTLLYGSLSVILTAVFSITNTLLQYLLLDIMNVEDDFLPVVLSAAVIAPLIQPLYRRIEDVVNRVVPRASAG
jgi:hypothetical protein